MEQERELGSDGDQNQIQCESKTEQFDMQHHSSSFIQLELFKENTRKKIMREDLKMKEWKAIQEPFQCTITISEVYTIYSFIIVCKF